MKDTTAPLDAARYVGKPELRTRYGLDPATILRRVRAGEFPPPVYIFGRARWILSDLQAWEAANIGGTPPAKSRNLRNAKVSP